MFRIKGLNKKENGQYVGVSQMDVHILTENEDGSRQISLMAGELLSEIRSEDGLCTRRFYADIETERLDYTNLSVGDVLSIENVSLQITGKGKRCFDECPIRKSGKKCRLSDSVAFARVVHSGRLKIHASGTETFQV